MIDDIVKLQYHPMLPSEKLTQLQSRIAHYIANKDVTNKELRRCEYEICLLEWELFGCRDNNVFWC